MEEHFGKRLTKKHLDLAFKSMEAANNHIAARVNQSLLEHMKAEGGDEEADRSQNG
jgi:hypothetical protein